MAGSVMFQSLCCIISHSPRCYKNQTLAFTPSQLFSSKSFLRLKKQSLVSALQISKRQRTRRYRSVPVVFAAQSNFLKALNKDEGPKGGGGTTSTPKEEGMEDSLEEARRIMEKYK